MVLGHAGSDPVIHVALDHIEPGQPFSLLAADLGENAHVTLEIRSSGVSTPLGVAVAGPDGHFETTLILPSSYSARYALLVAESNDGSRAEAWVQVGVASGTDPSPSVLEAWDLLPVITMLAAAIAAIVLLLRTRARGVRSSRP